MASSTQTCEATLTVGTVSVSGKTGQGNGHAEMDALHNLIFEDPWKKGTLKKAMAALADKLGDGSVSKVVSCPSRPCCKKCSAVLEGLGFTAGNFSSFSDEYNSDKMTEWGVSMRVGEVLSACDIDLEAIKKL